MIFLSHSSLDKPSIKEVAFELINEGIDVWLDEWEIENGDLLDEKINQGIKDSFFVVVFLSPNSLKSDWVQKELKEALSKENKENKKYLLLVKLKKCKLDKEINTRLYTDFSISFTEGLSKLVKFLKSKAQHIGKTTNPLIPIKINRLLHVDTQSLERLFSRIEPITKINNIITEQILIVQDKEYYKFKTMAYNEYDKFKLTKNNSEYISEFKEILRTIEDLEEVLINGIVQILNQRATYTYFTYFNLITSVKWFYKSVFFAIGAKIDQLINKKVQEFIGEELIHSPFGTYNSTSKFYKIKDVKGFEVWKDSNPNESISFLLSADSYTSRYFEELPFIINFKDIYDPEDWFKYFIPQMVRKCLLTNKREIWWDFEKAKIGLK